MTSTTSTTLQYGAILTGLGGGLALFLYGMRKMTDALKTVAGGGMKNLLSKLTTNPFTGAIAGALITAVIQSSSVTTVIVVGFITAGLMSLSQSIGVIVGANIGTTITAQIIAFKITRYALLLVAIGFLTEIISKKQKIRHFGIMLMGLGLIFFGMELMSDATKPLRTYTPFINLMQEMKNPFMGILVGAVFTSLVQSSSATTGIVIVLAGQGLITLEAGIALIFGANIGTCVTALLSGIGKPREAVQAASIHVLFNVAGVLLWVAFIPQFANIVRNISPVSHDLQDIARIAADTPRQIANAHTLFNIGNALIFIWLTSPLAKLVDRIVPKRPEIEVERIKPKYIDALFLEQPAMALDQIRRELGHLGGLVLRMTKEVFAIVVNGTDEKLSQLSEMDKDVDNLHADIIAYLGKLSLKDLVEGQPRQIYQYIAVANYIENIGDVIETSMIASGRKRIENEINIRESTKEHLQAIHEKTCWSIETALHALEEQNASTANSVSQSKTEFNNLSEAARGHIAKYLKSEEPDQIAAFVLETDIIENFKRLHTLARRIANVVLEVSVPGHKRLPE